MSKSTLDRTERVRILVVDDEPDVRLLLAREISDRGHEVVVAADSAQAMEEMGGRILLSSSLTSGCPEWTGWLSPNGSSAQGPIPT